MINKPLFYDSDCLISFLIIGECSILVKMFSKIVIPEPVHRELSNENTPSTIKNNFKSLKDNGFVEINHITITSPEYTSYDCIRKGRWSESQTIIGNGEAAVIALAKENDGIVASNNLSDVKEYTDKYDLSLITTSLILGKAVENNLIDETKANSMWKDMLNHDTSLPNNSFSDYYNNMYKTDCDDFLNSEDIFNHE